ncbi:hypothetical protein MNV49_005761 [Pseudohyphozyma bogoriensis]|nr:hypothetical protein MNV49_005761 [Pseudohyphozyma bogoriensis]
MPPTRPSRNSIKDALHLASHGFKSSTDKKEEEAESAFTIFKGYAEERLNKHSNAQDLEEIEAACEKHIKHAKALNQSVVQALTEIPRTSRFHKKLAELEKSIVEELTHVDESDGEAAVVDKLKAVAATCLETDSSSHVFRNMSTTPRTLMSLRLAHPHRERRRS